MPSPSSSHPPRSLVTGIASLRRQLNRVDSPPAPQHDQFFLYDPEVLWRIAISADLTARDSVIEIGAGYGGLTLALALQACRVVAVELDARFAGVLGSLPGRVDVRIGDGLAYLRQIPPAASKNMKLVANPPYSLAEPLLHELIRLDFARIVLTVPSRLVRSIERNPILSAFFASEAIMHLPPDAFTPQPRTPSDVIVVHRRDWRIEGASVLLRQHIYRHSTQLLRNSLREAVINYARTEYCAEITKNQARSIIATLDIPSHLLEAVPLRSLAPFEAVAANGVHVEALVARAANG